jgi:ABC-type transport system substrate-binding protein
MNLRNEHLKVKEVRQALSYAIDRKILVERAVGGMAEPARYWGNIRHWQGDSISFAPSWQRWQNFIGNL